MAEVKLTKNELRNQQNQLMQLEKYLPTLQLKKAMLQLQVHDVRTEIAQLQEQENKQHQYVQGFSGLLATQTSIDPLKAVVIEKVSKRYDNIAGTEIPFFEGITFADFKYNLFETPAWVDGAIVGLRELVTMHQRVMIGQEQLQALEKELREVSIRVNLFEKILIPRATEYIRVIKVSLADQQLAAVARAKVAKKKIDLHKSVKYKRA